jgi:hypothetical protein
LAEKDARNMGSWVVVGRELQVYYEDVLMVEEKQSSLKA